MKRMSRTLARTLASAATSSPGRHRHVPVRTCVACGRKTDKRELLRVVRTPQGTLEVDERGKKPGRGAYLCPDPTCWDAGLRRKRLEHTLRMTLSAQDRQMLAAHAQSLAKGNPPQEGA